MKNKEWIKKNYGIIIFSVVMLALSVYSKDIFYIWCLLYVLFIKLLLSHFIVGSRRKIINIIIWIFFAVTIVLVFYVNHYLPKGPFYSTGEYVCENDDRGPCHEQYIEDTRDLNIPYWAKILKSNVGLLLIGSLVFAGIISSKDRQLD